MEVIRVMLGPRETNVSKKGMEPSFLGVFHGKPYVGVYRLYGYIFNILLKQ